MSKLGGESESEKRWTIAFLDKQILVPDDHFTAHLCDVVDGGRSGEVGLRLFVDNVGAVVRFAVVASVKLEVVVLVWEKVCKGELEVPDVPPFQMGPRR